jgi:hypothetical protein
VEFPYIPNAFPEKSGEMPIKTRMGTICQQEKPHTKDGHTG